MARLTYGAPGVYVEEVPSARQPIAGVGTNTVGFIGIVPDTIYCPVANPGYDPVTARAMLALKNVAAGTGADGSAEAKKEIEAAKKEIEARISALKSSIEEKQKDLAQAQKDVEARTKDRDDAKSERDKLAADADAPTRSAADRKVTNAERVFQRVADRKEQLDGEIKQLEADIAALQAGLPAPGAAAGPGGAAAGPGGAAAGPGGAAAGPGGAAAGPGGAAAGPGGAAAGPGGAAAGPGAATAPAAVAEAESEDLEYTDTKPGDEFLRPSILRPYYFVPFEVQADMFATKLCTNFTEYVERFGDFSGFADSEDAKAVRSGFRPLHPGHHLLTHAVNGFFRNGGTRCFVARVPSEADMEKVLQRFESIDEVAILAAPGLPKTPNVWGQLEDYCEDAAHQNVFAILDCPAIVNDGKSNDLDIQKLQYDSSPNLLPRMSNHAAFYFPFIEVNDPAKRLQDEDPARDVLPKYRGLTHVAPSGHMAGIYARIDEERGVHKAPANTVVRGALEVKYYVSKPKQDLLNPQGVNCIRLMNGTIVVWGARTIGGDRNGEWKYINVRRFAGFLEESIDEGTQWVVFEPNDPTLWSKIRLNVTAFLTNVWRNGALFGLTPEEAFYVKCDAELNPPEVRDLGQVITEIGVAIVRPAEFVIFRITQSTGAQKG